ncbi:hypothetical protein [Aliirhizobium smilacinae]|uniref:Uncharacterized protein n=1 Tax=Aliirhizobium smilacinae TaxID=1395944 RepID=A0A5C4XR50_9HYPH|nr:hypothetical protein [Rhizobium smilacinae]TNM65823.1 hypothetical protein FHP24_06190 [Rhizobium smilacinae]
MVTWVLILSAAIGAVCGIWLHVVVFTILSVVVAAGYLLTAIISGLSLASTALWIVMLSAALCAGYIASHVLRYVIHTRAYKAKRQHSELEAGSKYLHDQQQP